MSVLTFGRVHTPCDDCFQDQATGFFHCTMNCSNRELVVRDLGKSTLINTALSIPMPSGASNPAVGGSLAAASIGEALTAMAQRFDEELYALTADELAGQWFFRWDDAGSFAANAYQFNDMLDLHKQRCRRWEEHHHGSACVVERVRDKYLMPRIREFLAELLARSAPPDPV